MIATYGGDAATNPTAEADAENLIIKPGPGDTYTEEPSCNATPVYADRATASAPTFQAVCVPASRGIICGAEFSDGLYVAPGGTVSFAVMHVAAGASRVPGERAPRAASVGSGSCVLATPPNSGTLADCTTVLPTLPAGSYAYTASYGGDGLYAARTAAGSFSQAAPATAMATATPSVAVALAGAGAGSVASSPRGIACPGHCTATFATTTMVTLTAVAKPGSAFAGFFGGGCDGPRPCSVPADEAPTVKAEFVPDTAAPPVNGRTVNLALVSGVIRVQGPNGGPFLRLHAGDSIPVGATVDASHGTVLLTSAAAATEGKARESAIFREGEFVVGQSLGAKLTTLALTGGSSNACLKPVPSALGGGSDAKRHQPHKRIRHLFGSGKGSFQTDGAYASATVRGTIWLTTDFCDGTGVTVTQGLIAVRDFVTHHTTMVPAGKHFFADAP